MQKVQAYGEWLTARVSEDETINRIFGRNRQASKLIRSPTKSPIVF